MWGETNKIVWSQLVKLLLALQAMEIEQTARDNILYLLDTVLFFTLLFLVEKRRVRFEFLCDESKGWG